MNNRHEISRARAVRIEDDGARARLPEPSAEKREFERTWNLRPARDGGSRR